MASFRITLRSGGGAAPVNDQVLVMGIATREAAIDALRTLAYFFGQAGGGTPNEPYHTADGNEAVQLVGADENDLFDVLAFIEVEP